MTTCQWFALCDQPATHVGEHPVLVAVPVCDEHAEWATSVVPIENAIAMGWSE